MESTQYQIDSSVREVLSSVQAGVDNAGVRASRKHCEPTAGYVSRDKSLIHDQRIRLADVPAEAVMSGESGLVLGRTFYRTATEKEAAADCMRIVMRNDLAASLRNRLERGFFGQQKHHTGRHEKAALVRPVRMQIDDRRAETCGVSCAADCCDDFRKRAAVIEVPVRKENVLDGRQVDPETPGIVGGCAPSCHAHRRPTRLTARGGAVPVCTHLYRGCLPNQSRFLGQLHWYRNATIGSTREARRAGT